jgi:hypothetical protein
MEISCPFREGQRCRVKRDYAHLNHVFHAGEEVVFSSHAYSPKDGVTRYWFRSVTSGDTNAWHAFDDRTTEADLAATFEPINAA